MTPTITHTVRTSSGTSAAEMTAHSVTLPAPPWGCIEATDRADTAPRAAPIRGARDWRSDAVLRHADRRRDRG